MDSYSDILITFLKISNQIKLYHWQTLSHPRHLATDSFLNDFNDLIDKFIETLTGRVIIENKQKNYRIKLIDKSNKIILENLNDNDIINFLEKVKFYLENTLNDIIKDKTDLLNIRDEMLNLINKLSYLFSLH